MNPHFAAEPYSVTIVDIYGNSHTINLESLVSSKQLVGLDAVVFWENLWWLGTRAPLDNYIDHVVRVTSFTNNTVRIEVIMASERYLHMMFINPLPASKKIMQSIVCQYMANNYIFPAESGVVYVKTHGARVPPLDQYDIWDLVNNIWATTWPPVFYR